MKLSAVARVQCCSTFRETVSGNFLKRFLACYTMQFTHDPYMGLPYMGVPCMGDPYMGVPYMGIPYMGDPYMGIPYMGHPYMGYPYNRVAR